MNLDQIVSALTHSAVAGGVVIAADTHTALLQIVGGLLALAGAYASHKHNATSTSTTPAVTK